MNIKLKIALALLLSALTINIAAAQKKDTVNVGTVTGLLRDSVHNYVMQSATLSIYKVKDNELVSYQLSNNFGKYQFKEVPVGIQLRLVATHVGYNLAKKEFTISPKIKAIDLKTMNMERIDLSLKEVTITATAAPMQMHGDTLEFNAAAFKLDTNAVIEDLLNKLPGVTVWADGVITVNGKKINRLLVEGKDFFGGDNKIALQNIPKDAVKKIQVYQNKDEKDPLNPKTDMNIVLKKDKKDGFFGKFGVGYGTDKHYAGDGMTTYFSPKTQFSLVGAANDVNKSASSVNTLMGFNSFKGEGINDDYHSDFRQEGLNVYKGTGFTASHDFSKDGDTRDAYYKTNMLKGEFFLNDRSNKTLTTNQTKTSISANQNLNQTNTGSDNTDGFSERSNASYQKRYQHGFLSASFNQNNTRYNSINTENSTSINDSTLQQSQYFSKRNSSRTDNSISGTIGASTQRFYDYGKNKMKSIDFELNYNFNIENSSESSKNITNFTATDTTQNKYFNRQYLTGRKEFNQNITTTLKNVISLIRRRRFFISMDITNKLNINDSKETRDVSDLASLTSTIYTPNTNQSNISHYKTIDERPALVLRKNFYKSLDNRFSKYWNVDFTAQEQFFLQRNSALQSFQNLDRSYNYFIPAASFSYNNDQYGEYYKSYRLSYSTSVQYPSVYELAPLNDNSNVYYLIVGNPDLKPAYRHQLTYSYSYYDQKRKNALNADINITAGFIEHNIIDSSNYDALGRTVTGHINGSGNKFINYNGNLNKAFKFKDHQFQLTGNSAIGYSKYNAFVNRQYYDAQSTSLSASAGVTYTYKSILIGNFGESFSGNKNVQGALSKNTYYTWATNFGFAFAFPRSVFFNTRVNFNNSKSSATDNVYYTIWNVDIGYRFMKGSNAEIKFSALDLLHQNRAVYNYANNNSIFTTTANVLKQYFMLTLAYYPRKFGLAKK